MVTESGSDSGGPGIGDHVTAGYEALERLGLSRDGIVTASLGHDEHGAEQLLILGGQTLVRMPTNDGADCEEFHRSEIRSVELLPARGLLLRSPGRRWLHVLSDADAVFLHEAIIELPMIPPTGTGGQAIPRTGWRDNQLAHLVGLVVMRAAEAEHNLSLVAALGGAEGDIDWDIFGRSGQPLIKRLTQIGKTSPAIADMAQRYRAWSRLRNQLVHSVRPIREEGHAGPITRKPIIGGHDDSPYTVETQDLPELVDLWYAFNWLYFDAMRSSQRIRVGVLC
jgi:hypothetical protein